MKYFCKNYGLKTLIRQPTCYKNPSNPACIDLILTNVLFSFQNICTVETGPSDFHLMTLPVMRKVLRNIRLNKTINYTTSKNFSNEKYKETLINNLCKENFINNDGFQRFCHISLDALDKHTPCNKKHAQSNHMPFFNKELLKAIMTKIKLQNIFLQNRSVENIICYTK